MKEKSYEDHIIWTYVSSWTCPFLCEARISILSMEVTPILYHSIENSKVYEMGCGAVLDLIYVVVSD